MTPSSDPDSNLRSISKEYLNQRLADFGSKNEANLSVNYEAGVPEKVIRLLSSREFTYLSRSKASKYAPSICGIIKESLSKKAPLIFYFTLGGGYHARIGSINDNKLSFIVGLGEFFSLYQIKKFLKEMDGIYPYGAHFVIILDNRCAELANEVPIKNTERYGTKFFELIDFLNMRSQVSVKLQSDFVSKDELLNLAKLRDEADSPDSSNAQCENAVRFSYSFEDLNAKDSVKRYLAINNASREVISNFVRGGIHLMQRATTKTLAFRSFPGGDCKIQCGEVALLFSEGKILRPVLVTTKNISSFVLTKVNLDAPIGPINNFLAARPRYAN